MEYAGVAADYIDHVAKDRGHAVKNLADWMCLSESQVRSLLYEARRRGLLTKAEPGKAGGRLTNKALELLRHNEGSK